MTSQPNSSNQPTSTPKYLPPHRRYKRITSSSSWHTPQPYLTYEDLHTKFSPNSPPLRMPRVERSLSAEDLYQRFHNQQQNQSPQEESKSRNSQVPGHDSPTPDHNPPQPRDRRALRRPRPSISEQPQRPILSTKLPDPPVFTGNGHVLFDDWKMRIQDKLTHNGDHYPTESFKIAYIITRLGGDASGHVSTRRRFTSYESVDGLLDHLSDLYEVPLSILGITHRRAYRAMTQDDQPFLEFYRQFRKSAEYTWNKEEDLIEDLRQKSNLDCTQKWISFGQQWTMTEYKESLMKLHDSNQQEAQDRAARKARKLAKQIALAKIEAASKPPGKYAIVARPDPEEFRR